MTDIHKSSVPGVIDYLVSQFTAAVPDGVTVIDGYPTGLTFKKAIVVGGEDFDVVDADQAPAQIGRMVRREIYNLYLQVMVIQGGTNQKAVRDAMFELYTLVETIVYGDLTLGGQVTMCGVSTLSVRNTNTDEAAKGRVSKGLFTLLIQNDYIPGGQD